MEARNFRHNGNIGDCIASLPAMKQYNVATGRKVNLYFEKDVPAFYYEGAVHPTKDANNNYVMLNQQMIDMMIPLFQVQPFINECKVWEGEEIHVDLAQFRETNVGMPGLSINRWYFYVYPDLACDLTKQWLEVPDSEKDLAKGKAIISRSERYRIETLDYSFLKPYEDDIVFAGTMREYNNFCMSFDLNIRKLTVNNFLELGQAIKQSRFHLSNQTMAFQISTGLQHKRLLEACTYAPNVIVFGEDAYDTLSQAGLEYYFKLLHKKTAEAV